MTSVAPNTNHLDMRPYPFEDIDVRGENLINVFLRMWDGKTLCCLIDANRASILCIDGLKQKVVDHYPGYAKRDFFLELRGKPLSTHRSLQSRLTDGTTVFVQYRNRGGCFMVSFTLMMTIFALILGSTCTCGTSLFFIPLLLPFLFVLPLFCL